MGSGLPTKICATCGRDFEWRRKWRSVWPQVRYCSERCRRQRGGAAARREARIADALEQLLADRSGTICPSEAARALWSEGWRDHLNEVRAVGRKLAREGRVVWQQRGRQVDPARARGPVRLARGPRFRRTGGDPG